MTKKTKNSKLIWQRQGDAIIYNPPKNHPAYAEWMKLKEKEKQDADNAVETTTNH